MHEDMKNTFAYFKNINNYTTQYNSRNNANSPIDDQTICFIEEGGEIYTHGKAFGGSSGGTTTIGGETINVNVVDGIPTISPNNLPKASKSDFGIVKIGNGIDVSSGTISVSTDSLNTAVNNYFNQHPLNIPIATNSTPGIVYVPEDGGLYIDDDGEIGVNITKTLTLLREAGLDYGNGPSEYIKNATWANNTLTLNPISNGQAQTAISIPIPQRLNSMSLNDLTDVSTDNASNGNVLTYSNGNWTSGTPSGVLNGLNVSVEQDNVAAKIILKNGNNQLSSSTISPANTTQLGVIGAVGYNSAYAENYENKVNTDGNKNLICYLRVNERNDADYVGYIEMSGVDLTSFLAANEIDFSNGEGTTVVGNPSGTGGEDLTKIQIGSKIFNIPVAVPNPYQLPVATDTILGGIKVGTGLQIDSSTGALSVIKGAVGNVVEANPDENAQEVLTKIKIDGETYDVSGGGTTVVANPGGTDGDTLTRIKIGNYNYNIPIGNIQGLSNAFSRVTVGSTNIDASGSDAFSLVAGTNITLIPSAANKTITINATGGDNGETTYIENPYDDTAVLNRITAAENSLRNIHNWTENEINALAKTQVDTYKTHKSDIGTWIETGDFDDELSARFVTLGYTQDENVAWSTLSQSVDQITASVNSLTQRQDGDDTRYTALNSSLNTQITKINDLETSVATLGTSYATLNEDADALSWLASYYRSETRNDRTLAQVFSDVQTSAEQATAAVQTQINTLDGRVTSAETSLASMVTDVNNLKSNSAGYLTSATLEGAVATMFASTSNGADDSGKGKVAAFIEARVGDMVSDAAQGTGALSELVLGADQITLEGDTTVAGKLTALEGKFNSITADYISSKVSETGYLKVYKTTTSGTADTTSPEHAYLTYGSLVFNTTDVDSQFNAMSKLVSDDYSHIDSTGFIFYGKDNSSLPKERNTDAGAYDSGISLLTRDGYSFLKLVDPNSHHSAYVTPQMFYLGATSTNSNQYDSITSSSAPHSRTTGTKSNLATIRMTASYDSNATSIILTDNDGVTCTITPAGGANTSDIRYKDIIDDIYVDINDIAAAPKFTYTVKDSTSGVKYAGTSAQYWKNIIPEVVNEDQNGALSMNYANTALIAAISAAEEIVALKNEIADLKQQIAALTSNN